MNKLKVLLIIEQCNPEMSSVPSLGYRLYNALSEICTVTLATHGRNEDVLRKLHPHADIAYFPESSLSKQYYKILAPFLTKGSTHWPLFHALLYPIYAEFNRAVYKRFSKDVIEEKFDIVHAFTPIIPRYPVKIAKVVHETPFFLGPVNGGIPFPGGFSEVAKKEHKGFNFLKWIGKFIPGYKTTYEKACLVWAGSKYTLDALESIFPHTHFTLLSENGIEETYFNIPRHLNANPKALFVGRLEPVKCVDVLIQALHKMSQKIPLTIVGDGSERKNLEGLVEKLNLQNYVKFTGWIPYEQLLPYYINADFFCFPSVKDFGGAVILEAMAAGLPIIGVNYGGVGEYADSTCGILLHPSNPDKLRDDLCSAMQTMSANAELRLQMGASARKIALRYTWKAKAANIVESYQKHRGRF